MRRAGITFTLAALLALAVSPAAAERINPNGFPSGEHYNLNIIGKKDLFACPDVKTDEWGEPVYGNVVFVPENGRGIEIFMESGRNKKYEEVPKLQVTDPCAGYDGDGASLRLPKNEAGYRVYARSLAKPTDSPEFGISSSLVSVTDENGNDLLYLGLVTDQGFETPDASFTRQKGKSKAVEITGLFEWSGSACYLEAPDWGYQTTEEVCCRDLDGNGMLDECSPAEVDPLTGLASCSDGGATDTVYCSTYEDEWVFNIGEFVNYLWKADNNGTKLLQVRFYPN